MRKVLQSDGHNSQVVPSLYFENQNRELGITALDRSRRSSIISTKRSEKSDKPYSTFLGNTIFS